MQTTKAQTRKVLAAHTDYDPSDCTSSGYEWTLYADGRVAAEHHSRWQGTRTGDRYLCEGAIDLDAIDHSDPDNDAEAALVAFARDNDPRADYGEVAHGWRQTRAGVLVR